jgi:hypothetical protein
MNQQSRIPRTAAEATKKISIDTIARNNTPSVIKVQKFLESLPENKDLKTSIYCWGEPQHGIRVSEVTFSKGNAGSSCLQSDPECAIVCFAVERLAMAYDEEDQDEILDAEWFLKHALFSEQGEHYGRA